MATKKTDVLIVGSGLAGLALALKLSPHCQVTLLAKDHAADTNTSMAQGGIAAVMSDEDSFANHEQDTITAGAGLCKKTIVEEVIEQAPDRIQDLINWGVHFDFKKDTRDRLQKIDLTQEGGHSFRRILHFEDRTGAEIHRTLMGHIRQRANINLVEDQVAIDLLMNKQLDPSDMTAAKCLGAYALDKKTSEVHAWVAHATILATGGAGKVYLYTSNWSGATGDGIAMAYRAGARVANLEFMQFHPTCLYHPQARNFLISEALRGEGGELIDAKGVAFMKKYHPMGSLAPRDIVARSIDAEMKKSGAPSVYLDMSHQSADFLKQRFPAIHAKCLEYGIDMTKQPIPVVPAAHYLCGGVVTNLQGQTDISQLWAIGETACTGLHGANRLASNSLLEAITMAHECAQEINKNSIENKTLFLEPRPWISPAQSDADELIVVHHMWDEIRQLMWNYVGIVRSKKRLLRAQARLRNILSEVHEYYSNFQVHRDIIELRNIAIVAALTVECALARKESRGIHYNLDYPFALEPEDTLLVRGLRNSIF